MRLALIGAGRWGRNYIRTIAGLPGTALVRLASGNPESHSLVPPSCVVTPDWRSAIAAPEVDAVIIATPPASHAEIALAAIAAGKAVLVEKPLALDMAEAEAIVAAARRAGTLAWVEHTQIFNPAWAALKAALPAVGRPRAIRAVAGNHGPYRVGVPILWDWGAHEVSQVLDLTGTDPAACSARYTARGRREEGETATVEIGLAFADGLEVAIELCNHRDKCRRMAVHGEAGVLVIDDLASARLTRHPPQPGFAWPQGPGEALPVEAEPPLTRAVRLFAQAVAGRTVTFDSVELGLRVVRVLAACQHSAEAA